MRTLPPAFALAAQEAHGREVCADDDGVRLSLRQLLLLATVTLLVSSCVEEEG